MSFSDVVEALKKLLFNEKQEIQMLLQQYLLEERREEIYNNYKETKQEEKNGKLKFTSNVEAMKQIMAEG